MRLIRTKLLYIFISCLFSTGCARADWSEPAGANRDARGTDAGLDFPDDLGTDTDGTGKSGLEDDLDSDSPTDIDSESATGSDGDGNSDLDTDADSDGELDTEDTDTGEDEGCGLDRVERFDTNGVPAGWGIENEGGADTWVWLGPGGSGYFGNKTGSGSGEGHFWVNSYSKGETFDEGLITGEYDLAVCSRVTLRFFHYFSSSHNHAGVYAQLDGGDWQELVVFDGSTEGQVEVELDEALVETGAAVRFGFFYQDTDGLGMYWQLDDVGVQGS